MKSKLGGSCALAALVGLFGLALPAVAQSSCGVTVTSLADSGSGSLRSAIAAAAASGATSICFQTGLQGTITLASTLQITSAVTITGPNLLASGLPAIVISGNNAVQPMVINASDDSGNGEVVSIAALEITGGSATGNTPLGGGIQVVSGNVTLNQMTITGNTAEAGGGVYNQGTLLMESCQVNSNNSTNGLGGGIVNLQGGSLTLQSTNVTSNNSNIADGGGIANSGTLVIQTSSISSNDANGPDGGGGLFLNGGTTTISGSSLYDNTVTSQGADGAGLYNSGSSVSITTSAFVGNAVSGNGPQFGGAIYNSGTLTASESTFAGNTALTSGGAIYNNQSLTLTNVTISTNSSTGGAGGGIEEINNEGTSLTMNNAIVAGNTAGSGAADCDGCGNVSGAANTIGGDAGLGPLAYNGGPTQSFMPLPGGSSIGTGNEYATQDQTDQRGLSRLTNGGIDRGAVQDHYSSVTFATQPASSQTVNQAITPSINVMVTEVDGNTVNYPLGVPVTMLLQAQDSNGTPVLSGGAATYPTATTIPATAKFPNLSINTAGSYELQATTYPTSQDGQMATYSSLSNNFTVAAPASTVTLSWQPAEFTYGVAVPAGDFDASATVNGQPGTGTFVYTFTSGPNSGSQISTSTIYPAGPYNVQVAFTPSGSTQTYTLGTVLVINQATPVVTVATPGTVLPGAVVSLANVHGTATGVGGAVLAGTFGYSPALGTALTSGQTVTVTFTPADTTDYVSGVTASTSLTVLAAQATTTAVSASPNPVLPGAGVVLTASVTPGSGVFGAVPGTEAFSVTSPSGSIATMKLALDPATANFAASAVQTYNGSSEYSTYTADFNGDGVADLLIVPTYGLPQVLFSVPGAQPSLAAAVPLNLGSTCSYVIGLTVGDVNGDGLPDVAAACVNGESSATTLVVVLNQGQGNFVPSPTVTTLSPGIGSVQMVLGNFNKSGLQGLVVLTDCYTTDGCSPTLDYLQGDGAGNFNLVNYELINNGGTSDSFANLVAADFSGDGYPDVAFLHSTGTLPLGVVEVWTNSGGSQPTFGQVISSANQVYAASTTITAGNGNSQLFSLVSADLNLDGKPDLALVTVVPPDSGNDAYSSISIALNQSTNGTLAFPAATTDTQGNGAQSSIVAADFDGDGVPDIALYDSYNGTVRVLHGAVQGGNYSFSFTEPHLLFTVNAPGNPPDEVAGPKAHGRAKVSGVRPADSYIYGLIYPLLQVGDTNGDGYPDLLVAQVTTDQNYNLIYQAQQFVTSGASVGSTNITAPNGNTGYTAATTPAPNPGYWAPSTGTTTLDITSIGTTTSLAVSPTAPVYGTPITLTSQVINAGTGAPAVGGSVTFSEDGTALSPAVAIDSNGKATLGNLLPVAGQHTFGASYGGATGQAPSSATNSTVTVAKFTPTISWPTPAPITTTTPLSGTQLDAIATGQSGSTLSLAGSYVYTPAAGATLPAGVQTLSVTFTPTDTTDYATVSKTVQIQVNLAGTQTTLTISPASPTTFGQALTFSAGVTNTSGSVVVQGGTVTFTADGVVFFASGPLVNGAASISERLSAGQHVIGAAYTGTASEGASSAGTQTIQVTKATPTLTWATPAAITTTTPLSAAQLDAAAAGVSGVPGLAGQFVYTPAAGTTLSAGTHTLSVTFTPTDAVDYNTATKTVQIQVNATNTQTVLTVAPVSSTYGQPLTLSAAVTNTSGSAVVQGGTVTFTVDNATLTSVTVVNGAASTTGVVLPGGTHQIGAIYAGVSGELGSTAAAQQVQIAKATPTLTWATPAAITTTTPLSGTQLDAAAAGISGATGLAGSFVYTPPAGTTLSAGTHTLSVTFTPTDATDYSTATKTVQIQVNATGTRTTFTVSPTTATTYGQPLTLAAQVTNTTGSAPVQGGTVTFTSGGVAIGNGVTVVNGGATLSGVTLTAGTHTLDAIYSPATGETGSTATSQPVTIGKATPVLTWPTPAAISSTTPLSAEQLDATAAGVGTTGALGGTFVYTPSSGTLTVGTHTLSVTFTPTDAVDYTTATKTVQIQVVNTNTQTTFTVSPASVTFGKTLTLAAQVVNTTGSAVIQTGSVVFASDNVTVGTVSVVGGAASLSGVALTGGQHLLTASYTGANGEGPSGAAARTITVAKATPVLTWSTPAPITSTTPLSGTQLNTTAAGVTGTTLGGTYVYSPAAGTLLTVGSHTLGVTFTPTDATDYAVTTAQVSIQVVAETIQLISVSPATTPLSTTPLPVTITGAGFPPSAVVQLNGSTVATKVISATQLGVTVPAADLAKPGTLSFTIYDAASQALSNAGTLSVTAPTPVATISAPTTTTSAEQPTVGITLANTYPVDIAGTFTLTFVPAGPDGVDDPAVQFSTGGRTFDFTIPAGSTVGPTASLQSGTVEGTISVATQLTAGGSNVTPADLDTPAAITVAPSVPTITGVTFTDVNGLITVVITGYSNTREMTEAAFLFTGPGAVKLDNAGVTVPESGLFGTWYTSADSATFGSTFSYTQTFQLSDDTTSITGVAVTLTNTVGTSTSVNSQ